MINPREITILAVDDNDTNRYITSHILRQAGFHVNEAASGEDALAQVNERPDLVILDVHLPDIMGFEVCKRIKENPDTAAIPVLQISALYTKSEHKVQALEYGADGYIVTPIDASELVATVKSLLRLRLAEEKLKATVEELERTRDELEERVEERTAELSKARMEADAARVIAEEANRIKDEFLATVSHELRTPLTAILGWARLLRTGKLDTFAIARALEIIERNANAQAQLIDDLLDISRIITGKLHLEFQRLELAPIIEAAVETIMPAATVKNIYIQAKLDAIGCCVLGDANRLQQVIWNLLSNAVKFTPHGGSVKIWLENLGSIAQIIISDTGAGINADFLPNIFDRFSQEDGSKTRRYGGLGLGLAIVHHLVELHGGAVEAYSEGPGKGATFTMKLPIQADDRLAEPFPYPVSMDTSDDIKEYQLTGIKVLVVDDEPDNRELIKTILEQCHANIRIAASASEALEIFQAWQPEILISDIGMPGEDGYSLIQKIRNMETDADIKVPAIALTAFAKLEDREKALSAGFQAHIPKPVEPAMLAAVIANLLQLSGSDEK